MNILNENTNIITSPTKLNLMPSVSEFDKIQDTVGSISSPIANYLEENHKNHSKSINTSKRFLEEDIKNNDFDDKIVAV